MIPNESEIFKLHKKYSLDDEQLNSVFAHCKITAEIADWCASNKNLQVNRQILLAGCLLHDIGSYIFLSMNYKSRTIYPQHAIFGSALLQEEGIDKQICEMVKTHVLLGLTKAEIKVLKLALPHKNYEPQTLEARLLCYADRFSSKGQGLVLNSYKTFLTKLKQDLPLQAIKFESWATEFGVPDMYKLAKKYNCPIN